METYFDTRKKTDDVPHDLKVLMRYTEKSVAEAGTDRVKEAGIHLAYEKAAGDEYPYRIYIGTETTGPLAVYETSDGYWSDLFSNGNFGRNYACGGTWFRDKTKCAPTIFRLFEILTGFRPACDAVLYVRPKQEEKEFRFAGGVWRIRPKTPGLQACVGRILLKIQEMPEESLR